MKLLIITQKVDKNDSLLGTYHAWIEEFAKDCEKVTVICLQKGEYNLPSNVKVLSLGKEEGRSMFKYLSRFYKYIWSERKNYNSVFVHMNEEYVILAGPWWRLVGKRVGMFRNHIQGTWKTPIAVAFSNIVFCTSPHSYTVRFKKTKIVPAGIDIKKFRIKETVTRIPKSILSLGRIDPIKNIDVLVEALKLLAKKGIEFNAMIVGDPDPKNKDYYESVVSAASELVERELVKFHGAVPNTRTPEFYHSYGIFVNLTNSGSMDKTIFSAMASEAIPVISNVSFKGIVPDELIFKERDISDLVSKLEFALNLNPEERAKTASILKLYVENHSLEKTVETLIQHLS